MQQRFKQRSFTPEDFAYITDDDHLCAFAISGTAGVGTSSLLKGLKERLPRLRHTLSAGDTMRKLQKQFGFATIGKFAQYLTAHPNLGFDEYVDDQIQLTAMHDNSAVEGRIAYLFAPLAKKILVKCPPDICAERRQFDWAQRDNGIVTPFETVLQSILRRNFTDWERYRKKYPGYDWPESAFDLVLDSGALDRDQMVDRVLEEQEIWLKRSRKIRHVRRMRTSKFVPTRLPDLSKIKLEEGELTEAAA